jgi:hypothetical protein
MILGTLRRHVGSFSAQTTRGGGDFLELFGRVFRMRVGARRRRWYFQTMKPPSLVVLILAALLCSCASRTGIRPFATDGCSCGPDGVAADRRLWYHCCLAHDSIYWKGGPRADRKAADRTLRSCVTRTGHGGMGRIMYHAVRWFGGPWIPAPWRWGYGWAYPHPYRAPTPAEQDSIAAAQTRKAPVGK